MTIRGFSMLEEHCINTIIEGYRQTGWEYAAYIDASNNALIELFTRQNNLGADPTPELMKMAKDGAEFIVHHNHPSQGSLSLSDWNGAATLNFREIFAHSEDGTVYWGKAIDHVKLRFFFSNNAIDQRGNALLANLLCNNGYHHDVPVVAELFGREIANRAMKTRGYVEYDVRWGCGQLSSMHSCGARPVSQWAQKYGSLIEQAAKTLSLEI